LFIKNLFWGRWLASTFFRTQADCAPVITAKLTKIALLARILVKAFLLFFRHINFALQSWNRHKWHRQTPEVIEYVLTQVSHPNNAKNPCCLKA